MKKKRVIVGMSGGVDSSVTAALLKRRGYDVIGLTFQMLPEEKELSACCNIHTITDAKRVCHKLNIPHYTINIRDTFRKHVISPFVENYLKGLTPNPCVECNRHIKFDELERHAQEFEADFVATGHYCKRTFNSKTGEFFLKKAKDLNKDQTYFLYMLSQERLKRTLFPLGNLLKPEIRQLAKKFNLINANRPESQDICFVTGNSYKQTLEKEAPNQLPPPGNIITLSGQILGQHKGIHTVTIGQRKGLGISAPEPLYVLKINPTLNTVTVGKKDDIITKAITISPFSAVNATTPLIGRQFDVKSRYNMTPFKATVVSEENEKIVLDCKLGQTFITPGQSAVLYDKNHVIGGGIIV